MQTITRHLVYLFILVAVSQVNAQVNDGVKIETIKENIKAEERDALKVDIEAINKRLSKQEITYAEAEKLKKEAAEKRALNIENRVAIAVNRSQFLKRNKGLDSSDDNENVFSIKIGASDKEIFGVKTKRTPPKQDIRTGNQLLFAMGFNNAIIDGVSLSDTPYKLGGSGFVELGWLWNTRVFKDSNFLRFKYGFSIQWNKYDIKNDQYFVQNTNQTTLQPFVGDLKRAKFRTTSLVIPVHFEFGPWNKKEYKDGKLTYKKDGGRVNEKIRRGYNTNTFTYGVSAYIGIDDVSLYAKYDISPLFKNQLVDQNNISLGLRLDLD